MLKSHYNNEIGNVKKILPVISCALSAAGKIRCASCIYTTTLVEQIVSEKGVHAKRHCEEQSDEAI